MVEGGVHIGGSGRGDSMYLRKVRAWVLIPMIICYGLAEFLQFVTLRDDWHPWMDSAMGWFSDHLR